MTGSTKVYLRPSSKGWGRRFGCYQLDKHFLLIETFLATLNHCKLGASCIDWFVSEKDRHCSEHQDKVHSIRIDVIEWPQSSKKTCNHWPCHSMSTTHWQNHILCDLCPFIHQTNNERSASLLGTMYIFPMRAVRYSSFMVTMAS